MHFATGHRDEAAQLVRAHHYSGRMPNSVLVATWHEDGGLFGDLGAARCAVVFGVPPTRWAEDVIELVRLVRAPEVDAPLTSLIAFGCKMLKRRGHGLVVSFADTTQGHHGGVYQAASWRYHGQRARSCDGVIIGGQFVPGRSCNNNWGTRSPEKLTQLLGVEVLPHYDEGKHLYWRALDGKGRRKAQRLGLESNAYPKPGKGARDA